MITRQAIANVFKHYFSDRPMRQVISSSTKTISIFNQIFVLDKSCIRVAIAQGMSLW